MTEEIRRKIPGTFLLVILVIGLVLSIVIGTLSFTTVPTGSRGVLLTWGSVTGILGEGVHFKIPFAQSVVLMSVQVQRADRNSESAGTKDLQEVTADITVNYRVDASSVEEVYRTLGVNYQSKVVEPNIDEALKAVTAQYTATELISLRDTVKLKLKDDLQSRLTQYNIIITSVSFTDFQFSESFTKIIEEKVVAEQNALKAKNDLDRIRYEAQQQIIQAQAKANATIATATAEAQAQIIQAEANAEAIRLIQTQLSANPEYLQYLSIINWDGKLPYFFGGDTLPFITIPINSTNP